MALVMLPCDLPWWSSIQRHLTQAAKSADADELIDSMLKIHNMCNVGLEPEEIETSVEDVFSGLKDFLNNDLSDEERLGFYNFTLPCIAQRALDLKRLRPPSGLKFSLQQICDKEEFDRDFVASLLAHGFFSTFSKRTDKTHPTLQDFNFTHFFRHLSLKHQKCKLLSLFHYFNFLERSNIEKKIIFSRQVMNSSQWLTLDDWLNCKLPLCPLLIKRQGDINSIGADHIVVCSTRNKIGSSVLSDGNSVESIQLITCPEMLMILLYVEALEDNEIFIAEGVLQVTKLTNPKGDSSVERISQPQLLTFCCLDPDDYSEVPLLQYQQDSILRELNKTLLGFRQKSPSNGILPKRLSPIGESFSSTPEKESLHKTTKHTQDHLSVDQKFIVLGSSGECLPVMRNHTSYSSCHSASSDTEFHSARTSFTDEDPEEDAVFRKYSCQLDREDQRIIFAERLKEAMEQPEIAESEADSEDLRLLGRDGSCGFVLDEQSESNFDCRRVAQMKHETSASSKYSFTTDYSSELGVVYEQLSGWLDEDDSLLYELDSTKSMRERAVIQFAGNLLKRTLSESFVGVPVGDGIHVDLLPNRHIKTAVRSLSLELARHKSKLAAQLLDTVCRVLLDRQWNVGELVSSILKFSEGKILGSSSNATLFEHIICKNDKKIIHKT
nr:uncharacterized protein LOC106685156 isoform X3 [Halyomorpha halys]